MKMMIFFKPFNIREAFSIIQFSRSIIKKALQGNEFEYDQDFNLPEDVLYKLKSTRYGVFVTIEKIVNSTMDGVYRRTVRGSMGILPSTLTTLEALKTAATAAALRDPRRTPLHKSEFGSCVLEIMFISEGREVDIDELCRVLIPGYHMIVLTLNNDSKFIVMPHMQLEIAESLLQEKSSITIGDIVNEILDRVGKNNVTNIQIFETQIFYEVVPDGEVIERKIYLNRIFKQISKERKDVVLTQSLANY